MATKRQRGNSWHYAVKRAGVLPRPIYISFDDEEEGDAAVAQLEAWLDRGIVPAEFREKVFSLGSVGEVVVEYQKAVDVPASDRGVLEVVLGRVGKVGMSKVGYGWAEQWVAGMKVEFRLAPSTIRHHVGALARCFDWVVRRHPEVLPGNPLRALPRRYAVYSEEDQRVAEGGRRDVERDRRLLEGEEERFRAVLDGVRPVGRQRALELHEREALVLLLDLALESAMRMREMYTLEVGQVDLARRTVFLEKTKNGDKRQVPLSSVALARLQEYGLGREGLLFPWWDGRRGSLASVTSRLSRQFRRVFDAAGCEGLRFHDLRHEATCRLYERTELSDLQIALITGHKDPRMLKRYANLRGSDLAAALW